MSDWAVGVARGYKNLQVREFLDAAEEQVLRLAYTRADAEADTDDAVRDLRPSPAESAR